MGNGEDLPHPRFARAYLRGAPLAEQRGATVHRGRLLQGLSGVIVEPGCGQGLNFDLYPEAVRQVIGVEPEPSLRAAAAEAARRATVAVQVLPGPIFIDRGGSVLLGRLLQAALIATAAVWAVLQAVDGVALKHTVDAWADASGVERSLRFADAEAVRWTEWGLQAYFRLLFGLSFVLAGAAIWRTGVAYRWLGPVAILGGALYAGIGIAVGHTGLDKPGGPVVQLLFVTFIVGVLVAGLRSTTPSSGGPKASSAPAGSQVP